MPPKNQKKCIKIKNKEEQEKEFNEISFIKRTLKNNTHEVIQDAKIKRITTWRKSNKKFLKNFIYNILSLGILHLISLYYPSLYIKLYCNPWQAKECDYFLVENIYGQCTLCLKIHKKNNNHKTNSNNKDNCVSQSKNININPEYNIVKNLKYSFIYKSMIYEYIEETNEISPVYIDLSKMLNKKILDYFREGLSTENIIKKYRERFGKNEYNINNRLPLLFFFKNDIPTFIIVFLIGIIECIAFRDFISLFMKSLVILVIFILQFLNLKKIIINKYAKEYTLDGEKNKIKVKRKYLLKEYNNKLYVLINNSELLPGDIIYLKKNDFVPCDCIIIEGECIVNESNLTGNLEIFKKTSLEDNNEQFNYINNNINILFHGMKIIEVFSKANNEFISAICINTGPNTYKANLYSNILYFLEKNKKYDEYNIYGKGKKIILIGKILVFVFSSIFAIIYIIKYRLYLDKTNYNKNIIKDFL